MDGLLEQLRLAAEAAPAPAALPTEPGGPKRVLVVDDNDTNRIVTSAMVRKLGYEARCVSGGAEALDLLARERFALVLMDVQMPEIDGLAATRAIRSQAVRILDPQVPIVALTANGHGDGRARCLAAGMDGFLTKPIEAPT